MLDELKNKKITLDEIDKANPFKVPDGYFDSFQNKMADRIVNEAGIKQPKLIPAPLKPRLITIISLSFAVLFIVSSIFIFQRKQNKAFSASELAEIYEYSAINETSDAELINQLETAIENNEQIDNFTNSNDEFNSQAIDYLSTQDIDINSLIEAL